MLGVLEVVEGARGAGGGEDSRVCWRLWSVLGVLEVVEGARGAGGCGGC